MTPSAELLEWTRAALEHLFDLAFLRRHARVPIVEARFRDGADAQRALLDVIRQLKPPLDVPAHAPAWRAYNVLNLRYIQSLTQAEVAAQLNIGLRQLRREQRRAVGAVVTLLFEEAPPAEPMPGQDGADGAEGETRDEAPDAELADLSPGRDFAHVDELLRSVLAIFEALLEQQDLRVTLIAPSSLPAARANRMILRQLLISALGWLVRGARGCVLVVEAAVGSGQITLRFRKPIQSADESAGDGAPPPDLDAPRRLAGALQAGIAHAQDGQSEILSLVLPASQAHPVLMIDDNPHAIQLVQRYLQQSEEFYLAPVTDPQEALRSVRSLRPACIVLDLMMPDRDGWELLSLLKTHPETAAIPVVVSSVLRQDELARSLGAAAVLTKPFTPAQLLDTLRAAILSERPDPGPATRSA